MVFYHRRKKINHWHNWPWDFWLITDGILRVALLHVWGNVIQMYYLFKHNFCLHFKYFPSKCHLPVRNFILVDDERDFLGCLCSGYCRLFCIILNFYVLRTSHIHTSTFLFYDSSQIFLYKSLFLSSV